MRWETAFADPPVTAPVVGGDQVVLGTRDHLLVATDTSGKLRWSVPVQDPSRSAPASGPDGQWLVTGQSGTVYRVDSQGRVAWQGGPCDGSARWTPEGGVLLPRGLELTRLRGDGSRAFAFQARPHPLKETRLGPFLATPDGRTYVTTCVMLSEPKWELKALDPEGRELWSRPVDEVRDLEADPAGGLLLGGPRGVTALDSEGRPRWRAPVHCQNLIPMNNGTLVESVNELELLDAGGQPVWSFRGTPERNLTTGLSGFQVAVAPEGTVVLADLTWNWKEFGQAATLTARGELVDLGGEGSPRGIAFLPDGSLVVASARGLRAVNPGTLARSTPLLKEEDDYLVVGSVRVRKRTPAIEPAAGTGA